MSLHDLLAAFRSLPRAGALATACLVGGGLAAQTTVAVQCAADNTLYESATGAISNGLGAGLFVGVTGQPGIRRAVLRFDVASAVPAGARVLSAQLTINCVQSSFPGNVAVEMHRILQAWGEGASNAGGGGGSGAPAQTGDATWLHTFFATSFWTTPGGDFAATTSATIDTPPFGICSSTITNQLVTDVQSFLDTPSQNFGWLLKTDESLAFISRKIDSRQSTGTKPSLSVTYIMPGESAAFGTGCLVNGQPFTFAIQGPATGGSTIQMVQSNGAAGQFCANLISLDYDIAGIPLLPQCSLYLPLNGGIVTDSIVTLDGTGAASTPLAIPAGFPGLALAFQSAALDANAAAGYVLSNAALALLQ